MYKLPQTATNCYGIITRTTSQSSGFFPERLSAKNTRVLMQLIGYKDVSSVKYNSN